MPHEVLAMMATSDDLAGIFAVGVIVVAERVDGDKSLDEEVVEFDEESVFGGVEDHGVEVFADAVAHELDLLPFDEFAFGVGGAAFGLAGFLGDGGEFGFGDGRMLLLRLESSQVSPQRSATSYAGGRLACFGARGRQDGPCGSTPSASSALMMR